MKRKKAVYWRKFQPCPGCVTQAETMEELIPNIYEAVEGGLSVDIGPSSIDKNAKLLELFVCKNITALKRDCIKQG